MQLNNFLEVQHENVALNPSLKDIFTEEEDKPNWMIRKKNWNEDSTRRGYGGTGYTYCDIRVGRSGRVEDDAVNMIKGRKWTYDIKQPVRHFIEKGENERKIWDYMAHGDWRTHATLRTCISHNIFSKFKLWWLDFYLGKNLFNFNFGWVLDLRYSMEETLSWQNEIV